VSEDRRECMEMMKGRFNLKINHNLPMAKKIEKYANEEVAFHLHKNRNFINKLNSSKKEYEARKKIENALKMKMMDVIK
jgi:hypothetical protein